MPIVKSITHDRSGLPVIPKSKMQVALRESLTVIGKSHHRILKRRKFLRSAHKRYRHTKRSEKYIKRKRYRALIGGKRASGSPIDFVFSGTTKASVMSGRKIKATVSNSTKGRVKVILDAPVLNFPGWTKINLREEFERTHPDEDKLMFKLGERRYHRAVNRLARNNNKTTRIKV